MFTFIGRLPGEDRHHIGTIRHQHGVMPDGDAAACGVDEAVPEPAFDEMALCHWCPVEGDIVPVLKRRATAFLILTSAAIFVLIAILILLMTRPARAAELPEGVSCEQVRALVAEHGKVKALAWAFEHGFSIRQVYTIRRACKL